MIGSEFVPLIYQHTTTYGYYSTTAPSSDITLVSDSNGNTTTFVIDGQKIIPPPR